MEMTSPESDKVRRAVVVSFDRLHAGFLGLCGNDWIETPHLDRLAAEGVVFDQHFCENLDPAAVNHAWWTGQYQFPLDEEGQRRCPSLVDELHAQGVQTCLVVEDDGRDETAVAPRFGEVFSVRGKDGFNVAETETPIARVVERCREWLRESAASKDPWLLWVKSRGIPVPWTPPQTFAELYLDEFGLVEEPDDGPFTDDDSSAADALATADEDGPAAGPDGSLDWRYAAAMYAAYVTLVDRWVGRLLADLAETPGWGRTLVILTAGGGQSLGEHEPLGAPTMPLRSETAQTPLWICVPGTDQGCTRRQELVQSVDLLPTVLDWFCSRAGDARSAGQPAGRLAGQSLLPLIRNEPLAERAFVVMGAGRREWAIRTTDFFYVESGDGNCGPERHAPGLFEKPHDRWDQSDVTSQYPQVSEDLQAALRRRVDELSARPADPG